MSHFPVAPSFAVPGQKGLVCYQGRVNLARAAATTVAPLVGGAFTVPDLFATVTVTVSSSASFVVGDTVVVGERLGAFTTGAGPLSNPITFTAARKGSWRDATSIQVAGYSVISPSGSRTTVTTSAWSIPVMENGSSVALNVATPANVATSSTVVITNHAGVYVVTAKPTATSMTLQKVVEGDLPSGATCIAGDTNVVTGTAITQGTYLGSVPRIGTTQFFPFDIWYTPITQAGAAGSGLSMGVGTSPNNDSGRAVFCDISQSTMLTSASVSTSQYTRTAISAQDDQRIAIGWGLPIMATLAASGSLPGTYVASVTVRGFLSEIA